MYIYGFYICYARLTLKSAYNASLVIEALIPTDDS